MAPTAMPASRTVAGTGRGRADDAIAVVTAIHTSAPSRSSALARWIMITPLGRLNSTVIAPSTIWAMNSATTTVTALRSQRTSR